jgi:trimethylamine--corrinoid protein Co-methyltransferase
MHKLFLEILSAEEIEAIHNATLRILDEIGLTLDQPEACTLLAEAGARVSGGRVRLPPSLVEWALAQCPPAVSIRGRGGAAATLGDGSLHWHNLGGARDLFDPKTGQVRPATVQDVRAAARLLDSLENCTCITPFFTPQDVPGELMALAMYRHTIPHTLKPVHGPGLQTAREVRFFTRMVEVLGSPAEMTSMAISPVSPLFFPAHLVEAMMESARCGLPFGSLPCPTAGATAPLSLSGAIAQQNAEVLASIVLAQLVKPGLPVIYSGRLAIMEPRTGASVWGGVELGLASAGTVAMAHRYHLPVNVYGFSTNSHTLDLQNGFERALNALIPALAGADELSGIGEMDAGVSSCFAQMVIDDELAANVRRALGGFSTSAEALAVEVIAAAMNSTRNFLGQKHTLTYLKNGEIFMPKLAGRTTRSEWEQRGRVDMVDRAQAQAERLLSEHQVAPLDPAQERALDEILAAAQKELVTS